MKILLLIASCLILHAYAQLDYDAEDASNVTEEDYLTEDESLTKSLSERVLCAKPCTCGLTNPAVLGATPTLNRLPFALRMWVQNGNVRRFIGGAVLINNRYALTTASVLRNRNIANVTVSIVRLTSPQVRGYNRKITVKIHPLYNSATFANDIAIMKFNSPILLGSNNIFPICLPTTSIELTGKKGITATWGHLAGGAVSNGPRSNIAPIISNAACRQIANRGNVSDNQVCAGPYLPSPKSGCQSDYGGPLSYIVRKVVNGVLRNRHILAGLASYGYGCIKPANAPAVYTRPQKYLSFINDNTRDGACNCSF